MVSSFCTSPLSLFPLHALFSFYFPLDPAQASYPTSDFTETTHKSQLLAGAFPTLFLLGLLLTVFSQAHLQSRMP